MDDQAEMRTYGNTDLPEGTPERPLVTFALFAYNQEQYIREAVEGAFSQTYSPLEIILSDDCSNDRTFEIMEEMAREYTGPHLVKVARQSRNLGVLNHLMSARERSLGSILIVAAGDDVSNADRTSCMVGYFRDAEIVAAYSGSNGSRSRQDILPANRKNTSDPDFRVWFPEGDVHFLNGATAAYRRSFLAQIRPSPTKVHFEDLVLSTIAAAQGGKIAFCSTSLVFYRPNPSALTNYSRQYSSHLDIRRANRKHAEMHCEACKYIMRFIEIDRSSFSEYLSKKIDNSIRKNLFLQKAYSERPSDRAVALVSWRNNNEFRHAIKGAFAYQARDQFLSIFRLFSGK